jgi:hypothetical protein
MAAASFAAFFKQERYSEPARGATIDVKFNTAN